MLTGKIKKYMMAGNNSPKNLPYNAEGTFDQPLPCPTNPAKTIDCKIRVLLNVRKGIVKHARAEVFGEPAAVAAASYLIQEIKGQLFPIDIEKITPSTIAQALEINEYSVMFQRCIAAHEALKAAIGGYSPDLNI